MLNALYPLMLALPLLAFAQAASCSSDAALAGLCTNTGNEIVVDGTQTSPGTSPVNDRDDSDSWSPGNDPGTGGPPAPAPEDPFSECLREWDSYIACFDAIEETEPADPDDPPVPAMPAVTITDLARFAPDAVAVSGEPDDVGVAGLPTNFVASAPVHTVDGELFGFPISVRFTPVGFDFDYGDGTATTTADGGRSWAELGQAQFTPTATSHAYPERGEYLASVDVRYSAEIDIGVGWFPLEGELTTDGPDRRIRIFEAHTALVAFTCEQAAASPGC